MNLLDKLRKLRGCLVVYFKQQFSVFKQHYTYFHIFFHSHIFPKNIQTTLIKQHYQTSHKLLFIEKQCCAGVLSKIEQGGGENTQSVQAVREEEGDCLSFAQDSHKGYQIESSPE